MVCDFCVSSIVPFKKTLCPASPSLQRVAWAKLPRLPGQPYYADHRYYFPLRLPAVRLRFVRFYLSLPDTLSAPLLSLAGRVRASPSDARTPPCWLTDAPDRILLYKETTGSLKFPGCPREHMPWSVTPVVSRTLATPGLFSLPNALGIAAFRSLYSVGFPFRFPGSLSLSPQ